MNLERTRINIDDKELVAEKKERTASFSTAAFLAPLPGIVNTQSAIARELRTMGVETTIFSDMNALTKDDMGRTLSVDWLFISMIDRTAITNIQTFRRNNPKLNVCFIEQTEGDVGRASGLLSAPEVVPDLIFTVSDDSLKTAKKYMPSFKGMMSSVGNAEFDTMFDFSFQKNRKTVRDALSIGDDDIIVTYIGRPAGAVYGDVHIETRKDVNADVYRKLYSAICEIAKSEPERIFYFLYLPHPVEKDLEYITKLEQTTNNQSHPNVRVLTVPPHEQQHMGIGSCQICAASDLNTTIRSSLAVQTSLFGVIDASVSTPVTLHVLLKENDPYLETETHPKRISQVRYGAALSVRTSDQLPQVMVKSLFDEDQKKQIFKNQQRFAKNYHFGRTSNARVAAEMIDECNRSLESNY